MEQVGLKNGVTRERIRQICEHFESAFKESKMAAPALDRIMRATARITPASIAEVNEQLARFIGEGAGIECLLTWAKALGQGSTRVRIGRARVRVRNQLVDVKMVEGAKDASWLNAAIRHASHDCAVFGCTNVVRVAGLLALGENLAPGQEAIEAALSDVASFHWLDKDSGWFTLGDSNNSAAAARVRKIMAVAQEAVGADEIAAAFASDDLWIRRDEKRPGLGTPPVHVLRELFSRWNWLRVVQKGRFAPARSFDSTHALSEPERLTVDVVERHGGVACRFELREAITAVGRTNMAVSGMLGSSPIIEKVEFGLYKLRGRRVGNSAVDAARTRFREKLGGHTQIIANVGREEYLLRVTAASLRNEQYQVPPRYRVQLTGQQTPVHSAEGKVLVILC